MVGSEWCEKELMLAHKLDKPMFGVIIDDKVSIASLPPKLKDFWQANENWYKIASDRSRSVVIRRANGGVWEVGTGFIMKGSDVIEGYGSGIVIVTCAHVVKGVELVDVYFPSVDEVNDVKIGSIVFQSPASDLDISILPIEHGLLFGAVAIDDVTPDREASVSFAPAMDTDGNSSKTSLAMVGYCGC